MSTKRELLITLLERDVQAELLERETQLEET